MKTYQLKSPAQNTAAQNPAVLARFPALRKRLGEASAAAAAPVALSLGADLERGGACLAAQIGYSAPLALGLLTREEGTALVRELAAGGHRVAVSVEACGFGWEWQRELRGAGAEVVTLAQEPLSRPSGQVSAAKRPKRPKRPSVLSTCGPDPSAGPLPLPPEPDR